MQNLKQKTTNTLLDMLIRQILLLDESELQCLWEERFPDPEKREYYEELGRMFPSFKSRMMGMDIHGMLQAGYTVDRVGGEEFHHFTLSRLQMSFLDIVDSSLEGAWKRTYLIAVELDAMA